MTTNETMLSNEQLDVNDNAISDNVLLSGEYEPKCKKIIKYIEKHIAGLGTDALTQICRIIKKNDEKFTAKKDYVLINLGGLKDETIREIVSFIVFINKNENLLAQDEQIKKQIKTQFDLDNK